MPAGILCRDWQYEKDGSDHPENGGDCRLFRGTGWMRKDESFMVIRKRQIIGVHEGALAVVAYRQRSLKNS